MRILAVVALVLGPALAGASSADDPGGCQGGDERHPKLCEMYSWPSDTTAFAALPGGSTIVWREGLFTLTTDSSGAIGQGGPVPGAERVTLPPDDVRDRVRALARDTRVRLEVGSDGGR